MAPPRRFAAAAAAAAAQKPRCIGDELEEAAARLLSHEGARRAEARQPPCDAAQTAAAAGRVMVHNGRFLGATLRSTESHNQRLLEAEPGLRRRDQNGPAPPWPEARGHSPPGGRVRGLKASADASFHRSLAAGMVLSRIAGVKCKAIEYAASLDLIRALDRPLKLSFKPPPRAGILKT
ncbi:hypothetical protein M885DRAFT_572326 [Pelagophyceae sp. CCMP2097]|nr:hypothetical protein M885DRAFT_572326 [Pelagophyceae sp. CCMP2097]